MPAPDEAVRIDLPDHGVVPRVLPDSGAPADPDGLAMAILSAVAEMAMRSKRRQADLEASMCRAGIQAGRARVLEALELLRLQGWVDCIVPLHDGGMLLSVTGLGLEAAGRNRPA